MVAALLSGLSDLVDAIVAMKGNLFFLNGFGRLIDEGRRVLVESSVVSGVIEGVMCALMDDPRVCRQYDELWLTVSEDMLWICKLPHDVWVVLASVAMVDPVELRSSCISAAHTAKHFFWRRVLEPAGQRPWSLARGDLSANLRNLALEEEPPQGQVTWQFWLLMRAGFSLRQLVKALELIADIGRRCQ